MFYLFFFSHARFIYLFFLNRHVLFWLFIQTRFILSSHVLIWDPPFSPEIIYPEKFIWYTMYKVHVFYMFNVLRNLFEREIKISNIIVKKFWVQSVLQLDHRDGVLFHTIKEPLWFKITACLQARLNSSKNILHLHLIYCLTNKQPLYGSFHEIRNMMLKNLWIQVHHEIIIKTKKIIINFIISSCLIPYKFSIKLIFESWIFDQVKMNYNGH